MPRAGWSYFRDKDGTIAKPYNTAQGMTLEQCQTSCADGTWENCVGFSRFNYSDTASAACWWVTATSLLLTDDDNDNEDMFRLEIKKGCSIG